ncbi:MAG TPA: DsbA family protein [Gaiellaceae bacterium]|jgi:protein-disulfide isomerase|nr:DsbA family protein [Gaiellaceae bacterium]
MQSWLRGPKAFALAGGLALLIAGALVAASVLSSSEEQAAAEPPAVLDATPTTTLLKGIPQDGNALGRPDAPVTLVEYADLQCPYCAMWAHEAFPTLVNEYVRTGKLRIEFRGLAFIGPQSQTGLQAVMAAGEQDRLWHVLDLVYHNQGHENSGWLNDETLRQVGAAVPGLDVNQMLNRRAEMSDEIAKAQAAATAAGIDGTPSFQVGPTGGRLQRVQVQSLDAEALRPAIESLLGR